MATVKCPCGVDDETGKMIECENDKCSVWQHKACVLNTSQLPPLFFCEICRLERADPFCQTVAELMSSTKLKKGRGTQKFFKLTQSDFQMANRPDYELQVWCILLDDAVPFRFNWPSGGNLHVNGVNINVINRAKNKILGANSRDDGVGLVGCVKEGWNNVLMSHADDRSFCFGIRVIQRCSIEKVLSKVPSIEAGEPFVNALSRVQRSVQGEVYDDDDNLDVTTQTSIMLSLRCPLSGSRINVPGRFKSCLHMGCFDLYTFVELNQKVRKWQCPICLTNCSVDDLIVDSYLSPVLAALSRSFEEDVMQIEVLADGSWHPKKHHALPLNKNHENVDEDVVIVDDSMF